MSITKSKVRAYISNLINEAFTDYDALEITTAFLDQALTLLSKKQLEDFYSKLKDKEGQ